MRLYFSLLTLLTLLEVHSQGMKQAVARAKNDNTSTRAYRLFGSRGRVLRLDDEERAWLTQNKAWTLGAETMKWASAADSCAYDADYLYPALTWGAMVGNYNGTQMPIDQTQESRVGWVYTAYGRFDRPLWRSRRWMGGYGLGLGVGWATRTFHPLRQTNNRLVGAHANIFFSLSLWTSYRFAPHWSVDAALLFAHHSNGAAARPNKGINYCAPQLGLTYHVGTTENSRTDAGKTARGQRTMVKRWLFPTHIGVGGKALQEEYLQGLRQPDRLDEYYKHGHYRYHPSLSLASSVLYRYALRWASGVGMDVNYASGAKAIERIDQEHQTGHKHSPFSLGVALRHEAYYRHWAATISLGAYLYRRMGATAEWEEKPYYERVGIRYYAQEGASWYVGAEVKAHSTKADFAEVVVGYRF